MQLYNPVHNMLCRFVQTLVWEKEDAKDVISETVLITFENLDKIRDEAAFLSYLFSVSSNVVNKKLRRKKFWGMFHSSDSINKADSSTAENKLLLYELNRALQKLPQKQREAIVYYEISGLTMEHIAEIQQQSVSGVKTSIHRARKALALLLEHDEITTVQKMKGVWYE
jgi:RNA polymerase sigma factor (sigma-70 family)